VPDKRWNISADEISKDITLKDNGFSQVSLKNSKF
jgi:hypothetical protein